MAPPRIALASRGFRRARRAEIPHARVSASARRPGAFARSSASRKKKTTVRRSRRLDPRRTSGGRRLDARARRRERRCREGNAGRVAGAHLDETTSARRAVSSGPSRALHAGFHIVRLVRFFHPGRPVRHTGPVRLRSRCPTDRPEAGRGGGSQPLPVAEDAPAPAVRPRRAWRRATARPRVAPTSARRDATVARTRCAITARREGGAPAGLCGGGEVRRGRGVPFRW